MHFDAIDQNVARSRTIAAFFERKVALSRHKAAFFRNWSTFFENNEGRPEKNDESLEMASTASGHEDNDEEDGRLSATS